MNNWVCDKVLSIGILLSPMAIMAEDQPAIGGVVIDRDTNQPISSVQVSAIKLKGKWKFWTLPENIVHAQMVTDESGEFHFEIFEPGWILQVNPPKQCWTDYREVIRKDELEVDGQLSLYIKLRKRPEMSSQCEETWEQHNQ